MLDIELIRKRPDFVKEQLEKVQADSALVDKVLFADMQFRACTTILHELQANRKRRSSVKAELTEVERADRRITKQKIKYGQDEASRWRQERDAVMLQIPNLPHPNTPYGKNAAGNRIVKVWVPPDYPWQIPDIK